MDSSSSEQKGTARLADLVCYWVPVLLWMIVIFSASADPASYQHSAGLFLPLVHWLLPGLSPATIEELHHLFRKSCHLTEYAVLALLLWRAMHKPVRNDPRPWNWAEAGMSLAGVFAYAAGDELHQVFVPNRTAMVSDVLIDTSGGAAALLLLWLGRKMFRSG